MKDGQILKQETKLYSNLIPLLSEVIFTVNKLVLIKQKIPMWFIIFYSSNCKLIWIVLWSVRDPRCFLLLSFCTSSHLYYTFVVYRYYYTQFPSFVVINEWNTAKKWRNSFFFFDSVICWCLSSLSFSFLKQWITQISYLTSRGLSFRYYRINFLLQVTSIDSLIAAIRTRRSPHRKEQKNPQEKEKLSHTH